MKSSSQWPQNRRVVGAQQPRNLTGANPAYDGSPQYSPDGRYIAYRMQRQPGYESDLFRLVLYDRAARTARQVLAIHPGAGLWAACDRRGVRVRLLTPAEAAAVAQVSTRTSSRWVGAGEVHFAEMPEVLICLNSLLATPPAHLAARRKANDFDL